MIGKEVMMSIYFTVRQQLLKAKRLADLVEVAFEGQTQTL